MTRTQADRAAVPETAGELIRHAAEQLQIAGIPAPREEARLLLQHATGLPAASVLAHPEATVPSDQRRGFLAAVERRSRYEPFAYITGVKEFFGLPFEVNPSVLVPRPETEMLVEQVLSAARNLGVSGDRTLTAVDLGTGSGAIAVALAVNLPSLRLIATDSSAAALQTARRNAARHGSADRIEFRQSDLLEAVEEAIDILVANLPYIPSGETGNLMPDVRQYEPRAALDGGRDGTGLIQRALQQAVERMARPSALLFEIGHGQGDGLVSEANRLYTGARVAVARDHAGFERVLSIEIGME